MDDNIIFTYMVKCFTVNHLYLFNLPRIEK